jgi:transcriptional regulator with XRE-family HTH domain
MPLGVRRSLSKFGTDLSLARRKRRLTAKMMAERIGVSKATYQKMEKGDPGTSFGAYAMALFVLGFGNAFGEIIDQRRDDQGLLFDAERVPKRVRVKPDPKPS